MFSAVDIYRVAASAVKEAGVVDHQASEREIALHYA